MPALYSLGVAAALRAAQSRLLPSGFLIAYLDDLYVVTAPERARAAYDTVTAAVWQGCGVAAN